MDTIGTTMESTMIPKAQEAFIEAVLRDGIHEYCILRDTVVVPSDLESVITIIKKDYRRYFSGDDT